MVEKLTPDRRTVLKALGAGALFSGLSGVSSATPGRRPGPKKDEILVGVSASADDMRKTVEQAVPGNARVVHANETLRYVAVKFPSQAPEQARENFIDAVTKKDHVKYAEENATYETFYTPNDPLFSDQYADQMVNAQTAWEETLGDAGVTVAVVDQGVQYDHPDLQGNMAADPGYDFVDEDTDPYPEDLSEEIHGTHVAGIAAASIDNGTGVTGIGNSTILSARALGVSGSGSVSDIADGIQWAADQGADVINLSLGGSGGTQTMKNAASYATAQGALIVAAAGNNGTRGVSYPAALSECMAVSALNPDESFASYSQYGEDIELTAPGTNVLSTWPAPGTNYNRISGTSMATPMVAGVAGLTLAQWNLTNVELRSHLKNTAVDIGLPETKQGAGRVDAGNAVTTQPGDGGGGGSGSESVSGSVSDSLYGYRDYDDYTWSWYYSSPSAVVVELDGPADADFDLYINTGTTQNAGPNNYDYAAYSPDSQEVITIDNPNDSTPMQIDVDSYRGDGSYTLTITESS